MKVNTWLYHQSRKTVYHCSGFLDLFFLQEDFYVSFGSKPYQLILKPFPYGKAQDHSREE